MPYCRRCGSEVQGSDVYCGKCGTLITRTPVVAIHELTDEHSSDVFASATRTQDFIISPARIILVSILSYGLYLIYWFYLSWKHFRDYTKTERYPVWHALTLFVPIYGYYRMHNHISSYKELLSSSGYNEKLRPGWGVVLLLLTNIFGYISFRLALPQLMSSTYVYLPNGAEIILDILSILTGIILVLLVQNDVNRFWKGRVDMKTLEARVGIGEVIFCLIGILAWSGTLFP